MLSNGASYTGQWFGPDKHGHGIQKWKDGSCYEGNWNHNVAEGKGKLTKTNGDVYEGEWSDNKANGYGSYTHAHINGSKQPRKYIGEWVNDL